MKKRLLAALLATAMLLCSVPTALAQQAVPEAAPAAEQVAEDTQAPQEDALPEAEPSTPESAVPEEGKLDVLDESDLGYIAIRSVELDRTTITLRPGESTTLYATIYPNNTTASRLLRWSSSDTNYVTVRSSGINTAVVTAHKTTGEEWVTVTTSNGRTALCKVVVTTGPITEVRLDRTDLSLQRGEGYRLTATVLPTETTDDKRVTWSSDNTAVASVDSSGYISTHAAGSATITVRTTNNITANCVVRVHAESQQVRAFVTRLYHVCFNREPDAGGLNNWVNALINGALTGADVMQSFLLSAEMNNRGLQNEEFIRMVYQATFDRAADEPGLANWMRTLDSGCSRKAVVAGFIGSAEFAGLCDRYGILVGAYQSDEMRDRKPNLTRYVNRLYNVLLERSGEVAGLNDWCNRVINQGVSPRDIAYGFVFSNEFTGKKLSDRVWLEYMYLAFMGRHYDDKGMADWLSKLRSGVSKEEVYRGFAYSQEFTDIIRSFDP